MLEVRAVGPFFKNGFVVGCRETARGGAHRSRRRSRRSCSRLPSVRQLSIRHILLTHAHVDHVTGVAAAKRALGVPVYLHRDDLFLYDTRRRDGRDVRSSRRAAAADRRVLHAGQVDRVRRLRGAPAPHAGPLPGRRVPRRSEGLAHRGADLFVGDTLFRRLDRPDRSAWRRLRRRCSPRSATCCFRLATKPGVYPGHGPDTTIGQERRTNPFLS